MTESCSSAAVAGDVDVLRLELVEAAVSGSGALAHLSTSEVAPAAAEAVDEAAAAAASARRPRMKSLSDELEPHFEEPDEALSDGGYCHRFWGQVIFLRGVFYLSFFHPSLFHGLNPG